MLTLARADQFQNRFLASEGLSSPLLRWAGVSTVVTRKQGSETLDDQAPVVLQTRDFHAPLFIAEKDVAGKIVLKTYEPGHVRAAVFAEKPATLVFSEVDYPGWQALVDGRSVPHGLFVNTFSEPSCSCGSAWGGVCLSAGIFQNRHGDDGNCHPYRCPAFMERTFLVGVKIAAGGQAPGERDENGRRDRFGQRASRPLTD